MDTTVGSLYDVYGGTSVNFGSNQLLNYYGANVVNWGSNYLLSNNSTSATTMSIDWESRYLADTAGTQRLKWTASGVQVTGSLRSTGGFTGSLEGTSSWATAAASASTQTITTNALHYPIFVDADNATPAAEKLGTDANYNFNPSTNRLNITGSLGVTAGITGSLSGVAQTASAITITDTSATNATFYPLFSDGLTGAIQARGDSGLTFNSLTNTLTTGTVNATASYATMASQSGYTLQFVLATTGSTPAANTTYRMGAPQRDILLTTSGQTRIYVPRPGRVRSAYVYVRTNGTLASAGTSSFALGKNSSTAEVINTSSTVGFSANAAVSSSAISMSVVQGDFLEINWTTPAWATTPTGLEANAIIYIENNLT